MPNKRTAFAHYTSKKTANGALPNCSELLSPFCFVLPKRQLKPPSSLPGPLSTSTSGIATAKCTNSQWFATISPDKHHPFHLQWNVGAYPAGTTSFAVEGIKTRAPGILPRIREILDQEFHYQFFFLFWMYPFLSSRLGVIVVSNYLFGLSGRSVTIKFLKPALRLFSSGRRWSWIDYSICLKETAFEKWILHSASGIHWTCFSRKSLESILGSHKYCWTSALDMKRSTVRSCRSSDITKRFSPKLPPPQ